MDGRQDRTTGARRRTPFTPTEEETKTDVVALGTPQEGPPTTGPPPPFVVFGNRLRSQSKEERDLSKLR